MPEEVLARRTTLSTETQLLVTRQNMDCSLAEHRERIVFDGVEQAVGAADHDRLGRRHGWRTCPESPAELKRFCLAFIAHHLVGSDSG